MAYVQTILMLLVFVNLFDTPVRGSLGMAVAIPVTMAFCGMTFGMSFLIYRHTSIAYSQSRTSDFIVV